MNVKKLTLASYLVSTLWISICVGETDFISLKADFTYKFLNYVDWKSDHSPKSRSLVNVCTLSNIDSIYTTFRRLEQKKSKWGRITVIKNPSVAQIAKCHLIYIASDIRKKSYIDDIKPDGILTLADENSIYESSAIFSFSEERNKISFITRKNLADSKKIKISTSLLLVSKKVIR